MEKDIVLVSESCQRTIRDMQEVLHSMWGFESRREKPDYVKVIKNKNRKKNPSKTNYKNKKKR